MSILISFMSVYLKKINLHLILCSATAKNKKYLKILGITHLLNAAEGKRFGCVNTNKSYYSDTTIKYLGLPLIDMCTTDISKYFNIIADFIDEAISTGGNETI